jgi:hypothetical protein
MTQETTLQHYRGVLCGYCRQPIPVPGIVEKIVNDESERGEKRGGTFNLRCRACEREKPYRMSEIVEVEGTPRPRSLRARHAHVSREPRLARAANG